MLSENWPLQSTYCAATWPLENSFFISAGGATKRPSP